MSAFKDQVAADIKGVFINDLEFADIHLIDGVEIKAVVDEDMIDERQSRVRAEYADGVFEDTKMLYVEKSDLPAVPVRGQVLNLDGKDYFVDEVREDIGVLSIMIGANDT